MFARYGTGEKTPWMGISEFGNLWSREGGKKLLWGFLIVGWFVWMVGWLIVRCLIVRLIVRLFGCLDGWLVH